MENKRQMTREEREIEQIMHGLANSGLYRPGRSTDEFEDRFVRKSEARTEEEEQAVPTVDM